MFLSLISTPTSDLANIIFLGPFFKRQLTFVLVSARYFCHYQRFSVMPCGRSCPMQRVASESHLAIRPTRGVLLRRTRPISGLTTTNLSLSLSVCVICTYICCDGAATSATAISRLKIIWDRVNRLGHDGCQVYLKRSQGCPE